MSLKMQILALIGAATVGLSGCHHSNSITGPAATPTPTPVSISGSWVGSFVSDHALTVCITTDIGSATAELMENESRVTGGLSWHQGLCKFDLAIQATRNGDMLAGTATYQDFAGMLTGSATATELTVVVGVLDNGHAFYPGGKATLHRP